MYYNFMIEFLKEIKRNGRPMLAESGSKVAFGANGAYFFIVPKDVFMIETNHKEITRLEKGLFIDILSMSYDDICNLYKEAEYKHTVVWDKFTVHLYKSIYGEACYDAKILKKFGPGIKVRHQKDNPERSIALIEKHEEIVGIVLPVRRRAAM